MKEEEKVFQSKWLHTTHTQFVQCGCEQIRLRIVQVIEQWTWHIHINSTLPSNTQACIHTTKILQQNNEFANAIAFCIGHFYILNCLIYIINERIKWHFLFGAIFFPSTFICSICWTFIGLVLIYFHIHTLFYRLYLFVLVFVTLAQCSTRMDFSQFCTLCNKL